MRHAVHGPFLHLGEVTCYNGGTRMRPAQMAQLGFVLIAAVAVYAFVSAAKEGERRRACTPICALQPSYAARNRLAPDFELPGLSGGTVRLSDYRGKVVLLNFWTKTCRPCLEEMPSLAELAAILADREDIVIITVSTDESVEDARDTLQALLEGEPRFVSALDADAEVVAGKYGTKLYPETWFIDPRGVIRARVDGVRDWKNPLAVEFAESLRGPITCSDLVDPDPRGQEFLRGRPVGELAAVCEETGVSG